MDTIDIISFTESQFATLTKGQLQVVTTAQRRKNRLLSTLQNTLRKEKHRLVKNGLFHSEIYNLLEERLTAEYENEVELIKQYLLFYLHYSMKPDAGDSDAPYTVDYSLSVEERLRIVKNYYESNFSSAKERYDAFLADKVAPSYLGELYAPLYDYFYLAV